MLSLITLNVFHRDTSWCRAIVFTFFTLLLLFSVCAEAERKVLYWYDPMVPDKHFDQPGKSPFMDMQLVPKYAPEEDVSGGSVTVSSSLQQTLGVRTAEVSAQPWHETVHGSGRFMQAETERVSVTVRADGYVEQLLVKAEGEHVERGQKIASLYAPTLQTAQAEYLLALKQPGVNAQANRARLLKLGMSDADIAQLTESHQILPRISVYAPASGYVMDLAVREGSAITQGGSLMQLANHQHIWFIADIPEREAAQVHTGQTVLLQPDSQPGTTLTGTVQYIYPELDVATRSLKLRVELENSGGKLRPGMYAQATLSREEETVLSVPSEAVIATGTRTVVIVKQGNYFRPANVRIGREQGGLTEILDGLKVGETVVTSGQFLIDSEASLSGVLARMGTTSHAADTQTTGAQP
ncbi:MAG TPA: efflux RND transporter periplasmic adaptor subunit [Pseudomonadales bacterium]|nr:efflux RND transporter periplasmic adaptor subunit [Pseudomonadales bacterium]